MTYRMRASRLARSRRLALRRAGIGRACAYVHNFEL